MATIVTRAGKGEPLTHAEVDANFTNLNDDIFTRGKQYATRAAFIADTAYLPPNGTVVTAGEVSYVRDAAATAIPDLAGWLPLGDMTPLHFGAVGDGAADDTAAFVAMWAYYETFAVAQTSGAFRLTVFGRSQSSVIHIPAGRYIVNDNWRPNSSAGRSVTMRGDGPTKSVIIMPTDATAKYLIEFPEREPFANAYHHVEIKGIKVVGGKGLMMNFEKDAAFVQRGVHIEQVDILGFTECGIGSLWGDDPRWTLKSLRIETTAPSTRGLYLPRGVANGHFEDLTIVGCTYRVVTAPGFQSASIISGLTMFSLPSDDHEADIWFKTIAPSDQNDGRGIIITGNRFSNENRNGKPVVLIADGDGVGGEIAERHSTAISARRFRDWIFTGNAVTGSGSADVSPAGPMIVSYAADIGASEIRDNSINAGFSELLWLASAPTGSDAFGVRIGPNQFVGAGEAPAFCNRGVGLWISETGTERSGAGTPISSDGGIDPAYKLVGVNNVGNRISTGNWTLSNVNSISATDAFGFSDARSVIYNTDAGYAEIAPDATQLAGLGLEAGDNYYFEWEAQRSGASLQLTEVDVEIVATMAGGTLTRRWSYRPTIGWRRNRIAFQLNEVPTALQIRFYASPDNWSASSDRTRIARPYLYRANRPQFNHPTQVMQIEKALLTAATASVAGRLVFVTNEAGGPVLAFSDGTNWRRVTDRAIVS